MANVVSKILQGVGNRFAQDHQKLLNQDIIAKYIGMLVVTVITPFAVFELVNARYQYFLIDMIVILLLLQDLVCMRVYAKPLISRYVIVAILGAIIWLLTYYRGPVGVYWSYPYVLFSLFLLRSRSSAIIIFLFLVGMSPLTYHTFDGIHALRVMVTLTISTAIIWFVSFVVTQQRSSLSENRERYKTLVETSLQGLLIVNENEQPIFANAKMARLLGFNSPEELTSLDSLVSLYHPEESERLTRYTKARLKNETAPTSYEVRWLKKNGTIVWFLANVQTLEWNGERVAHGVYIDITDRKRAEENIERHRVSLSNSKKKYETLVESSLQGFLIVNEDEKPIFANKAMAKMLGFDSPEELTSLDSLVSLYHPDESERLTRYTRARLRNEPAPTTYEIKWYRKDRSIVWLLANVQVIAWDGKQVAQALYLDITERKRAEQVLSFQATHDSLTGLINRQEFERRLGRVLGITREPQDEHVLCYMDLDKFKVVNDTCGHMAGDELLRQVGRVLSETVRKRDTLARLGGDEFGVLMEHCTLEQARRVATKLHRAVADYHFTWEKQVFQIGVSIGLVPITEVSETITNVLSAADSACYTAKNQGRNRVHVYRPNDLDLSHRQGEMQWVARLNQALAHDRLQLWSQPIVPIGHDLDESEQFEILLRLVDEDGSTILPEAFLPAAERYGLSTKLDSRVVSTAFNWMSRHPERLEKLRLCSINLSGTSLADDEFLAFVQDQLRMTRIPPHKVCFEVTETAAIANLSRAMIFMETIKEEGCRFALDDFGSGLSSFAYLKTLPVDYLKIDGEFVKDIADDKIDLALVRSINDVGKVMGKVTIAEFVENEAILGKLREIGVDYAQGYGIGRPIPM